MAAAVLARAGWKVAVFERNAVAGGAVASAPLTVPGYTHDPYSAFYGILHSSPVFELLELGRRVEWARFATPVAAAPLTAAPPSAPNKPSCNPPYEFDENGNKRWKRECL